MASLADRIKKNKPTLTRGPGGVLTEQSPEEIQKLSQAAGLKAPPITPLGQSLLGASKDQQKMAGTPQQKQAALTLSQEPTSLSDSLRRQQVRTTATADEQAKMQKEQSLEGLGQVGSKVQQFIQAQKEQLQAAPQAQVQASTEQFGGTQDLAPIATDLETLRNNPQDLTSLARVNEFLGRDVNSLLDINEINQLYQTSQQAISQAGATAVQDTLKVSDLVQQGNLGYDTNQLASLLGMDADSVAQLSIPELNDVINRVMQEEFTSSMQTQAQAVSPLAGGAERAAAQALSREQSQVGVTATEADFARLENQIANADTVSFGGEEMTIEQALSDDTISRTIVDYMNAAPGSESRKLLEQTEPELIKFINDNQALFDATVKQLGESATELKDINVANKGLVEFGGVKLDDSLAAALIPGYGKISTAKIDRTQVPALQLIDSLPPESRTNFVTNLNDVYSTLGKQYVDQLVGMSKEELDKLGVTTNSQNWNIAKSNMSMIKDLRTKGAELSPTEFQRYVTTTLAGSPENLTRFTRDMELMGALGEPPPGDMSLSYWLLTNNGKGRSPWEVISALEQSTNSQSFKNMANNNTWDANRIAAGVNTQGTGELFNAVADVGRDGVISMEESQKVLERVGGDLGKMRQLSQKLDGKGGMRDAGWLGIQTRELAKQQAAKEMPQVEQAVNLLKSGNLRSDAHKQALKLYLDSTLGGLYGKYPEIRTNRWGPTDSWVQAGDFVANYRPRQYTAADFAGKQTGLDNYNRRVNELLAGLKGSGQNIMNYIQNANV